MGVGLDHDDQPAGKLVTGIVLDSWGSEATLLLHNLWFDGDWQRPRFTDSRIVDGLTADAHLMRAGPAPIKQID